MPIIYAHRGGAALRPENTVAAFDHGIAHGAEGLEFDVHLSKDGIVVVHHDETLERTTNGRGRIADFTADELARIDAGHNFGDGNGSFPFRGQEIATTGDGFLVVFDSATRAVRAGLAMTRAVGSVRLRIRVGIHTGEVEITGDDVRGLSVHVAARVAGAAGAGEVLVSATTHGLLFGSGLTMASRGTHSLKGIEQPVELFAVEGRRSGAD